VYAQLVAKLYATRPAVLVAAGSGVALVGGITAWRSGDEVLGALTLAVCALLCGLVILLTRSSRTAMAESAGLAAVYERRFAILALSSTGGVGMMAARAIAASDDALIHLMLVALGLSTVSTVLRNYFRPRIVFAQFALLILPGATMMTLKDDPLYWVLSLGALVLGYVMANVVNGLYREARDSLVKDDALLRQNLRFDAALANMAQGLCMFDGDGRLVVCNQQYLDIYGFSPEVVKPGISLRRVLEHSVAVGNHTGRPVEELHRVFTEQFSVSHAFIYHNVLADGRIVALSHEPMKGGGWVTTHEDITERKAAEDHISYLARHDSLTGLPNRLVFRETLEAALTHSRREARIAVFCIDIDRFKTVNDTLGHAAGDALLKEIARRLEGCLRNTDTVARLGGDEFAVVQVAAEQPVAATLLADRMIAALGDAFEIDGHLVNIGTSIGISVAPDDGREPDQLLRNADLALYRAKAEGRGQHRFFAPEMDERMQARRALELDLRRALANREFELAYQPFVATDTGAISGFEALLRWRHPKRGVVMPAEFVTLAEEIGLVTSIGEWVLREACAVAAAWPKDVRIAVNLSPAQFRTGTLLAAIADCLPASGLAPDRLELEITEGVLLGDNEETLKTLHALRGMGVRIAMDDFGTGYSSLSYLRAFPFDKIKIDRSFVHDLSSGGESMAIVRAVMGLGKSLGMSTTAEGIETEAQLEQLKAVGCSEVQGYLLGRPMSAQSAATLLAGQSRDNRAA
jgi:diguanylate cyclase (GGDEF)-like protein